MLKEGGPTEANKYQTKSCFRRFWKAKPSETTDSNTCTTLMKNRGAGASGPAKGCRTRASKRKEEVKMSISKYLSAIGMAALLVVGMGGSAMAYHDGGVARCEGCHTMHNSLKGTVMTKDSTGPVGAVGTAFPYLLQGTDQSSTCLNCHEAGDTTVDMGTSKDNSYHISTKGATKSGQVPVELTPGGDFAWVRGTAFDFSWTLPRSGSSKTTTHGHNIIAAGYGYTAETVNTTGKAPGGTYPTTNLGCISCHDPHGKYRVLDAAGTIGTSGLPTDGSGSYGAAPTATEAVGVFRILGGVGYQPKSLTGSYAFTADPPAATAPSKYNHTEMSANYPTQTRVAYGSGMSEWCANCHTQMHNDSYPTNLRHPAGNNAKFPQYIADNYNKYVKTGDISGLIASSYNTLVPFETGDGNDTAGKGNMVTLVTNSDMGGPTTSNNVMCLSCHRAHASSFDSMMRWNNANQYLMGDNNSAWPDTSADPEAIAQGRTAAQMQNAYYGRPASVFALYQRSLCNKCHIKD